MESGAEGIILQPLWKIHNIDWSDRRNVFETEPSSPTLDLPRRSYNISYRYDLVMRDVDGSQFGDKVDKLRDLAGNAQLSGGWCRPLWSQKWSWLSADTGRSSA
ncbi:uncharacterized protein LOC112567226 [Pomacea canaliculata]|uniref:uncharacterized protein LOC112567226 n=1 Tax=Pomacea canaliculata TaxID=400727 RepID=UPI000D73AC97|nr:uncharacterized protein LOC112567226 [Pomacea canaliculata]